MSLINIKKKKFFLTYIKDDFYQFASKSVEYSKLIGKNNEFKILHHNLEYSRLASVNSIEENSSLSPVKHSTSNLSLTKRPLSDKTRNSEKSNEEDLNQNRNLNEHKKA